jgi:hypothetical protein
VDSGELSGTAGFLGRQRGIMDGKLEGNRISFSTTSLTTTGSAGEVAQDKHHYKGTIEGEAIRFTMMTDSSVSSHVPIHFVAKKIGDN